MEGTQLYLFYIRVIECNIKLHEKWDDKFAIMKFARTKLKLSVNLFDWPPLVSYIYLSCLYVQGNRNMSYRKHKKQLIVSRNTEFENSKFKQYSCRVNYVCITTVVERSFLFVGFLRILYEFCVLPVPFMEIY